MWALRRASIPRGSRGFSIEISHACAKSEIASPTSEGNTKSPGEAYDRHLSLKSFYQFPFGSSKFSVGRHGFSSQAGAKSSGEEDDLEDGLSELEMRSSAEANGDGNGEGEDDDELISGPELSDDDVEEASQNELELLDSEADLSERRVSMKKAHSALFKAILDSPGFSVHNSLDKWVDEGNDLSRTDISFAMFNLRNRRMYGRALQLSEWLEANKHLDFVERDYASRVDLIAKVHSIEQVEKYIENIPKSFKGEVIYRTLLANCVVANDARKAEEVFNKMQELDFPITAFACNQLLLLYKRFDKKKIGDVLLLMEKENVKPTQFTYGILIDAKCQSNDITGMDQIVQIMNAEGIEPDIETQAIIARHYTSAGLKAEAILKEMEGDNLKGRWICRVLLPLYAQLGKADDVQRVWKVCESKPRLEECVAAIDAWGKLKKIEEAEAVFDRMSKTWKLSSRHYSVLLKAYANNKMVSKGEDLVKQMADRGCMMGPLTWDALVKLYVEAGDVEKADSVLQKAGQQNQIKPFFTSYMAIMEQYARRGDVHNSEKMFHRMRQAGYVARPRQFRVLLQAYRNAKAPAYGMRERMKADNLFPKEGLAAQLVQVDAFRKTAVSYLLD